MTDTLTVQLAYENGLPFFVTRGDDPELSRVYGCTKRGRTGLVTFPAFLPFVDYVIQDLQIVYGERLQWTSAADTFIQDTLPALRKNRADAALPDGFSFLTQPFEHQKAAVVRAFHEPRTGIFFDCGLGKTKTAIDLIRAVKRAEPSSRVLVLCPSHLPRNWAREFDVHAPGELRVMTLLDANSRTLPPAKRLGAYTGTRPVEPDARLWPAKMHPDVLYTPIPRPYVTTDAWEELLQLEVDYVENVVNGGDVADRQSIRRKMKRRAKALGVALTDAAKMLEPRPDAANTYDVIVLPYSILAADLELIMSNVDYNMIVCDESHAFRTTSSNRSKAASRLMHRAGRRYLLSGTASLGHPMHLYVQLQMLGPWLVEGWKPFRRRYLVKRTRTNSRTEREYEHVVAFKNLDLLNEIVTEVAVRRKAKDCLDLPPVRTISVPVDVGHRTKEMYNELVRTMQVSFGEETVRVAHAADRLTKLVQVLSGFVIDSGKNYELCNGCPRLMHCEANKIGPYTPRCIVESTAPPKTLVHTGETDRLEHCMGLIDEIIADDDNKVIVWCQFTEEINMLEEALQRADVGYVRVDGSTKDKVAAEDAFQKNPTCRVYLAQIATGVGITLTAANYTIYYGVSFDLEHYEQSKKRNDRIGQTRPVTIYHLETPGSVNEYIFRALRKKQNVADTLTDHIRCALCTHAAACSEKNLKPFDDGCVYSSKQGRASLSPAYLT